MSARRHTQCPPVHHAGYLDCPLCGSKGYATEATWLDDERILATYVPSCTHVLPETMVVAGGHEYREADSMSATRGGAPNRRGAAPTGHGVTPVVVAKRRESPSPVTPTW